MGRGRVAPCSFSTGPYPSNWLCSPSQQQWGCQLCFDPFLHMPKNRSPLPSSLSYSACPELSPAAYFISIMCSASESSLPSAESPATWLCVREESGEASMVLEIHYPARSVMNRDFKRSLKCCALTAKPWQFSSEAHSGCQYQSEASLFELVWLSFSRWRTAEPFQELETETMRLPLCIYWITYLISETENKP